ncbi:hypothetical protein [Variovorax saccharolyticus]|uniref:hypothetical protein n=1 Tax=Variovorax saccharolyticus TaxID=3053516 RepID=UPI002575792D|nr:hypothetical protein [Variovorax sp. J22R187]MDM0017632.1 hypothetical protein [Variovorax sp. J22R187]
MKLMHSKFARTRKSPAAATGAQAVGTGALGTIAIGAVAIGGVAIGALSIGRLVVGRVRIRRLEIDELVVRRIHVTEQLALPPASDSESLIVEPAASLEADRVGEPATGQ